MLSCLALSIGHRNETARTSGAATVQIAIVNPRPSATFRQNFTRSGNSTPAFPYDRFVSSSCPDWRLSSIIATWEQGGRQKWP